MKGPLTVLVFKHPNVLVFLSLLKNAELVDSVHAGDILFETASFIETICSWRGCKKVSLEVRGLLNFIYQFFL